jgi:hypothetical protein
LLIVSLLASSDSAAAVNAIDKERANMVVGKKTKVALGQ